MDRRAQKRYNGHTRFLGLRLGMGQGTAAKRFTLAKAGFSRERQEASNGGGFPLGDSHDRLPPESSTSRRGVACDYAAKSLHRDAGARWGNHPTSLQGRNARCAFHAGRAMRVPPTFSDRIPTGADTGGAVR